MALSDLPEEILSLCCSDVKSDIKALRLTCKRFALLFAQHLFSDIRLLPTAKSARRALSILGDEEMSILVTRVTITPSLWGPVWDGWEDSNWDPGEYNNPRWRHDLLDSNAIVAEIEGHDPSTMYGAEFDQQSDDPADNLDDSDENDDSEEEEMRYDRELSPVFKLAIKELGRFPNLRHVELHHTMNVHPPSKGPYNIISPESPYYRTKLYQQLLKALNHPRHPASRLYGLRIHGMQDFVDAELATSDDFRAVTSRLRSLEFHITSFSEDRGEGDINADIEVPEQHVFFGRDLQRYWLEPLQDRLVHLDLSGREHWGYVPKCDLRGLHFPRLHKLGLGRMTFTHDWQLEWIVSHGETLRSLSLRDCTIIHGIWIGKRLNSENYPILTLGEGLKWDFEKCEDCNYWTYGGRWHSYLRTFNESLPRLQEINLFTSGESWLQPAIEPGHTRWATRSRYGVYYSASRYSDSQVHLPSWRDGNCEDVPDFEISESDVQLMDPKPWYPDCWEEDQKALNELVEAVRRRRQYLT